MEYDFSKLTPKQEWLICYQGWQIGQRYPDGSIWPQPTKRTVRKLIERDLMTAVEVSDRGMTVTEYRVPIEVHMAWCLSQGGAA